MVITVTVGMVGSGLIRTLALGTPAVPGTANASIGETMRSLYRQIQIYERRMLLLRGLAELCVSFRLGRPTPAKCAMR